MSEALEAAKVNVDRGEIDAAIPNLMAHLNTDFNDVVALTMLGACFQQKGHAGVAFALTHQAFEAHLRKTGKPFGPALHNMGVAFKSENHLTDAAAMFRLALEAEQDPVERAKLLSNLGGCFINEAAPETALAHYEEALRLRPDFGGCQFNRGLANLELGNWRQGWIDYEMGFHGGERRARKYRDIPEWDGKPDQTVIVWGEQGVGDEIQFASCLPDLISMSKKVILDCHPRLVKTFERSFPGVEIHGTRKVQGNIDWLDTVEADGTVCISSLPKFFRNRDEDFPGTPFLKAADPDELFLAKNGPRLRIGISWAGGTKKTRQDLRSIPLDKWAPILNAVDADFYSLQYTPNAAKEVCELEETTVVRVKHYPGWVATPDYDKTASFVASLDLVITVPTAVHHLANALGVPTWTLCPAKPSWRYTEAAGVWYANCGGQRFRQASDEPWDAVIARVAAALRERFA